MNESPKITVISEIFAANLNNTEPKDVLDQPEDEKLYIRRYPVLKKHLTQQSQQRLQVHYFLKRIQNDFIEICVMHVLNTILHERKMATFYPIIMDVIPDTALREHRTFICHYVNWIEQD